MVSTLAFTFKMKFGNSWNGFVILNNNSKETVILICDSVDKQNNPSILRITNKNGITPACWLHS